MDQQKRIHFVCLNVLIDFAILVFFQTNGKNILSGTVKILNLSISD